MEVDGASLLFVGGSVWVRCAMEWRFIMLWPPGPACKNNEWLLQARAPDVRGQTVGVVFIEREREQRSVP